MLHGWFRFDVKNHNTRTLISSIRNRPKPIGQKTLAEPGGNPSTTSTVPLSLF